MIKPEEKVKLLVIGDSIAAGYNSGFGFDISGSGKIKGEEFTFSGLSYGSFFCEFVEKSQKNKMESYQNFALQGSRFDEWLYFYDVDNEKFNFENSKDILEVIKSIDTKNSRLNLFKNRTSKQFNEFKNKNDFLKLKEVTKESNLIFISLGANDLIHFLKPERIDFLFDKTIHKEIKFKKFKTILQDFIDKTSKKSELLIDAINKLSNKANIVLLSYPLSFLKLRSVINSFLKKDGESEIEMELNAMVSKYQKKLSEKNENVHFVDVFDHQYWIKNASKLSKHFYEIHPSTKGYKKIAKNLFFKISFSKKNYEEAKLIIPSFDKKTYEDNLDHFDKILNFTNSEEEILKKLNWDSDKENDLILENEFERKHSILETEGEFGNYFYSMCNLIERNFLFYFSKIKRESLIDLTLLEKKIFEILIDRKNEFSFLNFIYKTTFVNDLIGDLSLGLNSISLNNFFKLQRLEDTHLLIDKILNIIQDPDKVFGFLKNLNDFGFFEKNLESFDVLIKHYGNLITNKEITSKLVTVFLKKFYNKIELTHKKVFEKYLGKIEQATIDEIFSEIGNDKKIKEFFISSIQLVFKNLIRIDEFKNLEEFSDSFSKEILAMNKISISHLAEVFLSNEKLGKLLLYFITHFSNININVDNLYWILKPNWKKIFSLKTFKIIDQNLLKYISLLFVFLISRKKATSMLGKIMKINIQSLDDFLKISNSIDLRDVDGKDVSKIINSIFENSDNSFLLYRIIKNPNILEPLKYQFKFNLLNIGKALSLRKRFYKILIPLIKKLLEEYDKNDKKIKVNDNEAFKALYRIFITVQITLYFSLKNSGLFFSKTTFLKENQIFAKFFMSEFPKHSPMIKKFLLPDLKIKDVDSNKISKYETLPLILFLDEINPNDKKFYNYEVLIEYLKTGSWI
ncbi:SGNH/GDSL hydrolase family protein [[Mycoplasma] mobile]|uniref:Putative esterase or lipase protein n=1 Tax=Mycoplasma mobile (strain ATCC 43663 / 163K / NCTC 11711) TaxID=267748 RepID=Q6KHC2_MYCM1|nr:SGNH/GDSL hydrolase family protein [[Mycoplasma] mobile]AAT28008.1 putative esterase or lipase protein [Mycoplasma mobile 163K]